jgi:hypothetical protein
MANNKVELATGEVLLDLTQDTVTSDAMLEGTTAHNAAGEPVVGNIKSATGVLF